MRGTLSTLNSPGERVDVMRSSKLVALQTGFRGWFAALLLLLSPAFTRTTQAGVVGTVHTEEGSKDLNLLSVSGNGLKFRFKGSTADSVMPLDRITKVRINIDIDRAALREAIAKRQHGNAAALLVKPLLPVLPFLELPNNNLTATAMDALTLVMRAADERALVGDAKARDEARKQYKVAVAFADAIVKADWYEASEEAAFRGAACLVALGELDKARERLDELSIPGETEDAFGWYAFAAARLLMAEERWEEALESGIESVVFENKDIDSFAGGMVLTSTCYAELGEWHRARDVHFALARLLKGTVWEIYSIGRLKYIMDNGLTKDEEKQAVHRVFFSGKEDLNGEAQELIDAYAERKKKGQENQ